MAFKKKVVRRRRRRAPFRLRRNLAKPQRGLKQSVHLFKRSITQVIPLADSLLPSDSGWLASSDNGIYKMWKFKLSDLVDNGDFKTLFGAYKICGVNVELSFNNTGSAVTANDGTVPSVQPGCQLQIYTIPNRVGRVRQSIDPLTEQICLNTQACKKRLALNGGKPVRFYMKTNQANMIYNSLTDTDYTVQKPRYISTKEPDAEHYGLQMYVNRVDGLTLSSNMYNQQSMRCTTTYYIACRGVE